jgi:uncharacterized membrane protein YeaQ/YmgE (transglycosylase-associated protein family)
MNLLLWVIMGLLAGWIASVVMRTDNAQGPAMDIILGVLGAIAGGLVMNLFGASGVNGFNVYSLLVATFGAVLLIWVRRALPA